MTTPLLAALELYPKSGLPADRFIWDMAFDAADATAGTLDGIADSIASFLHTANTPQPALGTFIGGQVDRVQDSRVLFYDLTGHLDGSPHGSPIGIRTIAHPAAAGGSPEPSEVCFAVSFHGDLTGILEVEVNPSPPPATIRPAARRRGRFYFGPVNSTALETNSGTGDRQLAAALTTALSIAATRFMDERPDFSVWSRADEVLYHVNPDGNWTVDTACDTQRRRGSAPTERQLLWP